ncbi:MAG: hypothetical protein ACR2LL_13645 [Nitrosopumilus sp.]|nr:hypothetical protein [Nitrosopumilus sp.]
MKIKYENCSHNQKITYNDLIFDDEDEEFFVTYLTAEMTKLKED